MKTGIYQIQTNDNENNEQSTMILASMDILAENFERTLEGERIIHPNIPNTIVIYSKNKNYQIRLRRKMNKNCRKVVFSHLVFVQRFKW